MQPGMAMQGNNPRRGPNLAAMTNRRLGRLGCCERQEVGAKSSVHGTQDTGIRIPWSHVNPPMRQSRLILEKFWRQMRCHRVTLQNLLYSGLDIAYSMNRSCSTVWLACLTQLQNRKIRG